MKVNDAVVHYFSKDVHKAVERIDTATDLIAPSAQLTSLVERILGTYNNKHAKQAGVFQEDKVAYPLAAQLEMVMDGKKSLLEASTDVLGRMEQLLNANLASSGGHLFFARYTRDKQQFMLVVKLMTEPGQVFRQLTAVDDATHLSVDRLQVAARINLTAWKSKDKSRYVTFVSTREGGHTSNYFRDFIGCDVTVESREESKKLAAVIDDFVKEKVASRELTVTEATTRKRNVFDHAAEVNAKQEPLSLAEVASLVWPGEREVFLTYLNQHPNAPADNFSPDRRALRTLAEYSYRSADFKLTMSLEFKLEHKVIVDAERLVIENPPADLIRELNDAL